jgi:hypothetical protein
MFGDQPQAASRPIIPGIYFMRTLFDSTFSSAVIHRPNRTTSTPVDDFSPYAAEFDDAFRSCLDQIFNPDIPFTQTTHLDTCRYCPFSTLCGR